MDRLRSGPFSPPVLCDVFFWEGGYIHRKKNCLGCANRDERSWEIDDHFPDPKWRVSNKVRVVRTNQFVVLFIQMLLFGNVWPLKNHSLEMLLLILFFFSSWAFFTFQVIQAVIVLIPWKSQLGLLKGSLSKLTTHTFASFPGIHVFFFVNFYGKL